MKTKVQTMESLERLYSLFEADLFAVKTLIDTTLNRARNVSNDDLISHLLTLSGKQVRPILTLLAYRLFLNESQNELSSPEPLIQISSAIELIHLASLVHDDVIDDGQYRRDQLSVNAKFGNARAVTVGVYLYSMSLELIAKTRQCDLLYSLSQAVKLMCEGELFQLDSRGEMTVSVEHYLNVVYSKTARLFMSSFECGAQLAAVSQSQVVLLQKYGYYLGVLFQLTDDYLDVFGDQVALKKEKGQDFGQGQFTLPYLFLFEEVCPEEKNTLISDMKSNGEGAFLRSTQCMRDLGVEKRCETFIHGYHRAALSLLEPVSDSLYKQALLFLQQFIVDRINAR